MYLYFLKGFMFKESQNSKKGNGILAKDAWYDKFKRSA